MNRVDTPVVQRIHVGPPYGAMLDSPGCPFGSATTTAAFGPVQAAGHTHRKEFCRRMRRYELMLVFRPDVPDERTQAVIDRTTRGIVTSGGSILKVSPWGRRRLAYQIDRYREGSYHIVLFEAPAGAISELERGLRITEEVLRHLVTRDERPIKAGRRDGSPDDLDLDLDLDIDAGPPVDEIEEDDAPEAVDESETEAAPAAID